MAKLIFRQEDDRVGYSEYYKLDGSALGAFLICDYGMRSLFGRANAKTLSVYFKNQKTKGHKKVVLDQCNAYFNGHMIGLSGNTRNFIEGNNLAGKTVYIAAEFNS